VELEKKCKLLHQKLKSLNNYSVTGIDISPVKHLRLTFDNTLDKLEKIVDYVIITYAKLYFFLLCVINEII
jgi:hypothetical protein